MTVVKKRETQPLGQLVIRWQQMTVVKKKGDADPAAVGDPTATDDGCQKMETPTRRRSVIQRQHMTVLQQRELQIWRCLIIWWL